MALQVIGAGFGRTGTSSLKLALEELGFGRCYHMSEIARDRDRAVDWWRANQQLLVDWEQTFAGFQSAVDWPACAFYKEFHQLYPEAKVILTVRDTDKWYESASETIYVLSHSFPKWVQLISKKMKYVQEMIFGIIWDGTFHGRFEEPEYAKRIFEQHIADVKDTIPAEQLLIFTVSDGWEPLCHFLEVPIPKSDFPKVNESETFKAEIKKTKAIFSTIHIVTAGVVVAALAGILF